MDDKFEYTYKALSDSEKKEVERIKNQYTKKPDRQKKFERLQKLDSKVKDIPTIIGLVIGIAGLLIFGTGMAMMLEWGMIIWGCLVGAAGVLLSGFAYFAYDVTYKKLKEKYRKEILSLSEELLSEDRKG